MGRLRGFPPHPGPRPPMGGEGDASDIHPGDWVDRYLPAWAEPYARLARWDRPIGTWLLLFPSWWGICLAGPFWPNLRLMALFTVGAFVMRGAGCTLNDIADRDYDGRVARTRMRPIPSGRVTVRQAMLFMHAQLAIGALVLLSLNNASKGLGVFVLALITTYPYMKRYTYWPQLFLGLNFNWGALMGWTAVTGSLAWPPVLLYLGGICWTLGYDTIYAHQDKEDDARIGVKSSALALGERTRPFLFVFYGAAVALWGAAAIAAQMDIVFWDGLVVVAGQLVWQAASVDTTDSGDCLAKFRANRIVGWVLLGAIVAGHIL